MFRIEKRKLLQQLGSPIKIHATDSSETEHMPEPKAFVGRCYGCRELSSSEKKIHLRKENRYNKVIIAMTRLENLTHSMWLAVLFLKET